MRNQISRMSSHGPLQGAVVFSKKPLEKSCTPNQCGSDLPLDSRSAPRRELGYITQTTPHIIVQLTGARRKLGYNSTHNVHQEEWWCPQFRLQTDILTLIWYIQPRCDYVNFCIRFSTVIIISLVSVFIPRCVLIFIISH